MIVKKCANKKENNCPAQGEHCLRCSYYCPPNEEYVDCQNCQDMGCHFCYPEDDTVCPVCDKAFCVCEDDYHPSNYPEVEPSDWLPIGYGQW